MKSARWNRIVGAVASAGLVAVGSLVFAADHGEAPLASSDQPADIADVFAWHEGDTLYLAMTFAGAAMPSADQTGAFDDGVLYGFHIDNTGDHVADIDVWVRFGQNAAGEWGMKVDGLPGTSESVIGAVGATVTDGDSGLRTFGGLRDDPFFFDLQGFQDTVSTGALSFASLTSSAARDSLAGTNATAIVLEADLAAAAGSSSNLYIWATTARKQ